MATQPVLVSPRLPGRAVFPSIDAVVARERSDRPAVVPAPGRRSPRRRSALSSRFPGDVLYAVKCNPEPRVLRALWAGGVRHFDCASLAEVALVRELLPHGRGPFHAPGQGAPGDPRRFRRLRRHRFRVRQRRRAGEDPAGDGAGRAGRRPAGLGPVRAAGVGAGRRATTCPASSAHRSTRPPSCCGRRGRTPRGSGSASMSARSASIRPPMRGRWRWPPKRSRCAGSRSTSSMSAAASRSAIPISCRRRSATISPRSRRRRGASGDSVRLWAEPGRALVAGGSSVVVQVQLRRGDALYVNDGVYGSLSDAGALGLPLSGAPHPPRRTRRRRQRGCASSRCSGRPATAPTGCADRSSCPRTSTRATGSSSASSAPTAPACAPASTASTRCRPVEVADPPMLATPGYEPVHPDFA